jgi:gp16 family phage-associated protein
MQKPATPESLKKSLDAQGITLAEFARQRGVDYQIAVQLVNGFTKGRYGKAHKAAIKLGLKEAA